MNALVERIIAARDGISGLNVSDYGLIRHARHVMADAANGIKERDALIAEMLAAAKLGLKVAEDLIHDSYDGTSALRDMLAELDPVRAALAKAEGKS